MRMDPSFKLHSDLVTVGFSPKGVSRVKKNLLSNRFRENGRCSDLISKNNTELLKINVGMDRTAVVTE